MAARITKRSMADEAVAAKTGKTWAQWFSLLDGAGARQMTHRDIARLLREKHRVPSWWSQMVTVEYERARGMRKIHETTQGFVANISRTVDAPANVLYRAWLDPRTRRRWLGMAKLTVTSATRSKVLRIVCGDATRVEVCFDAKSRKRCQIAVQHRKLKNTAQVIAMKKYWGAALERLKNLVAKEA